MIAGTGNDRTFAEIIPRGSRWTFALCLLSASYGYTAVMNMCVYKLLKHSLDFLSRERIDGSYENSI